MTTKNSKHYKAVIILGSETLCNYKKNAFCDNGILDLYKQNNHIAIGDGIKGITLSSLNKLKDKIDSNTRIDILAHGSMDTMSHTTQLKDKESVTTSLLLAHIKAQAKGPLHVEMWQCHGGGANKDAWNLRPGSILVTHTSASKHALVAPSEFVIKNSIENTGKKPHLSAEAYIMKNIALYSITPELTITKIKSNGDTAEFKIRTSIFSINAPKSYLKEQAIRFEEFSKISSETAIITEKAITEFQIGVLLYAVTTNAALPFLRAGKNTELLKSLINNQLNDLYPLHAAVFSQQYQTIDELFKLGANPDVRDRLGDTAIHYAVKHNDTTAINMLVEHGADINFHSYKGDSILHYAITLNNHTVIDKLLSLKNLNLNSINGEYHTALHIAVAIGDLTNVEKLLDAGANPNIYDEDKDNLLVQAFINARAKGDKYDFSGKDLYIEIAKLLFDHGANLGSYRYLYIATQDDGELTALFNELDQQVSIQNKYNDHGILSFFGLSSANDVIHMDHYGLYRGGAGSDNFIIYPNFKGKKEGYKLVITDFNCNKEIDHLDFSKCRKIKVFDDIELVNAQFHGDAAVEVKDKESNDTLVVLLGQSSEELGPDNFIFSRAAANDEL